MTSDFLLELKNIVFVILVCEFLKELLTTEKFKKYIQFAVSLFVFCFFLASILHTDLSFPSFYETKEEFHAANLLKENYQTAVAQSIQKELTSKNLSFEEVCVQLSEDYKMEAVTVVTTCSPNEIQSALKGEIPLEVVSPTEKTESASEKR